MILEGRSLRDAILQNLRTEILTFARPPKLQIILVGENPASQAYIRQKQKAADEIGLVCELLQFTPDISEDAILEAIKKTNSDTSIDGLIVQLPLPRHIRTEQVIEAIDPKKDVDGYSKENLANVLLWSHNSLEACTPKGVMRLLAHYNIPISWKNAVVVGYGAVGKPMSAMLSNAGATVTVCTEHTKNPSNYTKMADIIVVAVGHPWILKADMVSPWAFVIDVGINRTTEGSLVGDADLEGISQFAHISPVPGGVWPMTVAMLLENTVVAYKKNNGV